MSSSFAGKSVVVAGGAAGLGLGIALRFARAGARVIVADRDVTPAIEAMRRYCPSGWCEPLDLADRARIFAFAETLGPLDVWINSARVSHSAPAEEYPANCWEEDLGVILTSAFYGCQAAGQHMLKRGQGVIVNVASVEGYRPLGQCVGASVAYAGLIMLTQALAIEWATRGVRVVGVAPASVNAPPQVIVRRTPLGRLGTVDDVAEAVLFLASDEASYVVAETMRVDGGWIAYQLF